MDSHHEMRSYNSLLQPIRDLTENWDIDIAHLLEEYLDDLEAIRFTVNHNNSTLENLNFAEAALVIQGSTTIYSKKVEYLYQLVHHALELMSQTNSQNNQANQGKNDKTKVRKSSSSNLLSIAHCC
jgi:condensin-2 complex subunit H2